MGRVFSHLRAADESASRVVENFLDWYFYNTMTTRFRRQPPDTVTQVRGIDTIFTLGGREYRCDEKAAVRYINKPLNSFSMELSFINRANQLKDGWLIDCNECNDSFLFVWINRANTVSAENLWHPDQLVDVEYALVRRDAILQYLLSLGWDVGKLRRKSERLRKYINEAAGNIRQDGCKFTVSRHLVEQPVNVLIPRERLIAISDYTYRFQR